MIGIQPDAAAAPDGLPLDGVPLVLERGIVADPAIAKARRADPGGGAAVRKTARSFILPAATEARLA